jgi:Rps23 Pro-64 3,4-dihydroxylase Tpa1-like proline 4-hydroxylase
MNLIPNFLEPHVIQEILDYYESRKGTASFEVAEHGRWVKDLYVGNMGSVYVLPLENFRDYFTQKFSSIFPEYSINTIYMHIWNIGSHINWHTDGDENRAAATIYLNELWDPNWGGLFLFDNNGHASWFNPQYNGCAYFKSPMWHSVTMINRNAQYPRLSVQLFFNKSL